MARYWLVTYESDQDDPFQYEPHDRKPTRRDAPSDGMPWAIMNADFYVMSCNPAWTEAVRRHCDRAEAAAARERDANPDEDPRPIRRRIIAPT